MTVCWFSKSGFLPQSWLALTVFHACVFTAACDSSLCSADDTQKAAPAGAREKTDKLPASKLTVTALTEAEENNALAFASEHHPELGELLNRLRKNSPGGFSRGIREVHVGIQRLERFKEKQPARFEAELASWKVDSEIRLLTAKWLMSQDPVIETQIRELLRQRQQEKIDRLKTERSRVAERLEQLDEQIGMNTTELEADLADEWNRLSKRAASTAKAQRSRISESKARAEAAVKAANDGSQKSKSN